MVNEKDLARLDELKEIFCKPEVFCDPSSYRMRVCDGGLLSVPQNWTQGKDATPGLKRYLSRLEEHFGEERFRVEDAARVLSLSGTLVEYIISDLIYMGSLHPFWEGRGICYCFKRDNN